MIVIPLVLHFTNARAQVLPDYSAFPQSSIGFNTSTQGFGAQGSYSFLHFFNVRVGLDFSPGLSIQYNGRSAQLERASFYTMIDWQPMYGESSWLARKWFISTGAAYYFTNTLNREAGGTVGSYSIYMSKFRPYIGTGLGNIPITNTLGLRLDMGYFIPTSAPTATYDDRGTKVSTGLRGLLPGLNTGVTFCIKF
jgi:hypothetical protein